MFWPDFQSICVDSEIKRYIVQFLMYIDIIHTYYNYKTKEGLKRDLYGWKAFRFIFSKKVLIRKKTEKLGMYVSIPRVPRYRHNIYIKMAY